MEVTGRKILVVDDDPHLRDVLRFALTRAAYQVQEAGDGRAALAAFASGKPDLVILDILMPELDGTEVCRELRKISRVPIIFLTSLDEEADRVIGLELGGDDYIVKPFSPRELTARVRAVLRRLTPAAPQGGVRSPASDAPESARGQVAGNVTVHGRLRLDHDLYQAFWDSQAVVLTATEFFLLKGLLGHPGKVYTRAELMERAYDDEIVVTERTIDSHIRRIRRKFSGLAVDPIETVHGIGYKVGSCR